MEPPPRPTTGRRLSVRGACLAVAILCMLAAATGAIARSGDLGHHHHHHATAATAVGFDTAVAPGKRTTPDLAAAERPVADAARATARSTVRSTARPTGAQATPVRTRGPPATG